jgi:hypothetical protein
VNRIFYIFIVLIFFGKPASSQIKQAWNLPKYDFVKLHFGMALGFNQTDAVIHNSDNFFSLDSVYSVECQGMPGFNINIVTNYNFNKYASFRFLPGLNFGQRNVTYVMFDGVKFYEKLMQIESTYLDFPLLFQLKSKRLNNFRAYIVGGFSYKYDLSSQKKIPEDEKPKIRLYPNVYNYELGVGTDFFLQYFKFALELKFVVGINDIVRYDNSQYTESIGKMNSKMIMFSFLFEGSDSDSFSFKRLFRHNR